jgi:hypothetical protein
LGFQAGYKNTGGCSTFIGCNAGYNVSTNVGNNLSGMFVVGNGNMPSYVDRATALTSITVALGGVAGSSYFYYNQSNGSIEAVRL